MALDLSEENYNLHSQGLYRTKYGRKGDNKQNFTPKLIDDSVRYSKNAWE